MHLIICSRICALGSNHGYQFSFSGRSNCENIFREWERSDHPIPGIPGDYKSSLGRCSPRKVIRPTQLEVEENSASRSARMRIFEKALNA